MSRLENKVAIITGGNSGIGLATARLFASEGAKVLISGRREKVLKDAVGIIGHGAQYVVADAAQSDSAKAIVTKAVELFGSIDILFLNAGVAYLSPIDQIDEDHFDTQFNINVKSPFFTVKEALPYLAEGAVIISNTSIVGQKGFENLSVYSATKAALRSFTRVLANELKARKIRTVSVAPGPIDTPIYGKMGMPNEAIQEMSAGLAQQVPLGRFGSSEEIAESVLFLATSGSFVNGVELEVDGGLSQI